MARFKSLGELVMARRFERWVAEFNARLALLNRFTQPRRSANSARGFCENRILGDLDLQRFY